MTRTATSLIALAFALSAGSAIAAEQVIVNNETGEGLFSVSVASKSRDQVRAELTEAVRAGNVIVNNATGETARSLAGVDFAAGVEVGKTREQVRAELADAERNGELIANHSTLETFSQRYPDRYVQIGSGIDAS